MDRIWFFRPKKNGDGAPYEMGRCERYSSLFFYSSFQLCAGPWRFWLWFASHLYSSLLFWTAVVGVAFEEWNIVAFFGIAKLPSFWESKLLQDEGTFSFYQVDDTVAFCSISAKLARNSM
jgi:hypothetical protein